MALDEGLLLSLGVLDGFELSDGVGVHDSDGEALGDGVLLSFGDFDGVGLFDGSALCEGDGTGVELSDGLYSGVSGMVSFPPHFGAFLARFSLFSPGWSYVVLRGTGLSSVHSQHGSPSSSPLVSPSPSESLRQSSRVQRWFASMKSSPNEFRGAPGMQSSCPSGSQ